MLRINLNKAIARIFWIGAKYSKRSIHRYLIKPLAPYLVLLLVSIIGWKKYWDRVRKANLKSRLMDLPHDLTENILLRLPTKSICRMQCASKAFSSIINDPSFVLQHTSTTVLNNSIMNSSAAEVPQFILIDRSRTNKQGYNYEIQLQPLKYYAGKSDFRKSNYSFLVSKIMSAEIYIVEFVFRNLLFFKSESPSGGPSYLVNPFKGEVLMIPTTETNTEYDTHMWDWYGMGFDSTTNTYKIVHAYLIKRNQLGAQVYELRPKSSCLWRVIQSVPPCELTSRSVFAYGDMHWLVTEGSHLISFDFKKEEFCWTPHPKEVCSNMLSLDDGYLLNMKGSMTIVDVSSRKYIEIWVMKNYPKKEWSLDYRIDMKIFVKQPWDVFEYHTCGEWEKGIFFVRDQCPDSPLVLYYILDLQHTSMKPMQKRWKGGFRKTIFNYTGGLISLRDYSGLVEPMTQPNVWKLKSKL